MNAQPRHLFQLVIAAMFVGTSIAAVADSDFPGGEPQHRILEAQQKVDELFEKGDYDRAYFIYREELVPLGDKYAQYMVGYMNIVGKGTERDYIAGSAWYKLAAERGDEKYSRVRDEVLDQFSDEQLFISDEKYAEFRLQYSDAMIVVGLVEEDLDLISRHPQPSTMSNDLVDSSNEFDAEKAQLVEDARQRIRIRLQYLNTTIASGRPMAVAEVARIRELEESANAAIQ